MIARIFRDLLLVISAMSNVIQPLGQEHIFGAFWAKYCWACSSRSYGLAIRHSNSYDDLA